MSDKEKVTNAYKKFAQNLEEIEEKDKEKKKEVLKKGVMDLEQKYRDEIKGTHIADERLVKLRAEAGMSELIGTGVKVQKSNFKDKDKFEQFLAKEILEVGILESQNTGGVMTYHEFCQAFTRQRPNWEAPPKEIKKGLEYLTSAGLIPKLYKMKNDILITFKPMELQPDLLSILSLASTYGYTSQSEITTLLGWKKERAELALAALVEQEIAFYDKKKDVYYFPSLKM